MAELIQRCIESIHSHRMEIICIDAIVTSRHKKLRNTVTQICYVTPVLQGVQIRSKMTKKQSLRNLWIAP